MTSNKYVLANSAHRLAISIDNVEQFLEHKQKSNSYRVWNEQTKTHSYRPMIINQHNRNSPCKLVD